MTVPLPTMAADTSRAAELRQIERLRQFSPSERLVMCAELCAWALASACAAQRRRHPELDALALARSFAAYQWGDSYAARVERAPEEHGPMLITAAIEPVVEVLEDLQVAYFIGGSVAGSAHSIPRTTYDIDVIADLHLHHITPWIRRLRPDYYLAEQDMIDALDRHSSFNMTHQSTGINIDIFLPAGRPYDLAQFSRAQEHLLPGSARSVRLASAEDMVLSKLAWFELGGRVSDMQWRDVQALLRVQGDALDVGYLSHWAAQLRLTDLLAAAQRGERPAPPAAPPEQQRLL